MPLLRPAARHIGVATRDAVDDSKGLEEREGAVDLGGSRPPAPPVEPLQDVVGANRLVLGEDQLEHRPPILGEALAPHAADLLGAGEALRDARVVIVSPPRKW